MFIGDIRQLYDIHHVYGKAALYRIIEALVKVNGQLIDSAFLYRHNNRSVYSLRIRIDSTKVSEFETLTKCSLDIVMVRSIITTSTTTTT